MVFVPKRLLEFSNEANKYEEDNVQREGFTIIGMSLKFWLMMSNEYGWHDDEMMKISLRNI